MKFMNNKIVINPIGGLANRMRTLAGGVALANEIGAEFDVVWCRNWEVAAAFEDVFELPECLINKIKYPGRLRYGLWYSIPRKKNLYFSAFSLQRFGISLFDSASPLKDILANDNDSDATLKGIVEGTLHSHRNCFIQGGTNIYRFSLDEYRRMFVLKRELQEEVVKIKMSLGSSSVGVHIRRTDNYESKKHSPDSLFIEAMEREIDRDTNVRFYLATDDEAVKATFRRRFGERLMSSPYCARRDSKEGIIHAAEEMFILAGTNKILGSYYSSFSEAAAMLGGIQLFTVRNIP